MDNDVLELLRNTKKLIIYEQVNQKSSLGEQIKLVLNKDIDIVHLALVDTYLTEGNIEQLKEISHIQYDRIIKELE